MKQKHALLVIDGLAPDGGGGGISSFDFCSPFNCWKRTVLNINKSQNQKVFSNFS